MCQKYYVDNLFKVGIASLSSPGYVARYIHACMHLVHCKVLYGCAYEEDKDSTCIQSVSLVYIITE